MENGAQQLPLMPEPYRLEKMSFDGETLILRGPYVVGRYEDDDIGLRNLVIVSLREAGHSGRDVAECFGLSVPYVSALRGRAKRAGSLGLVRKIGRPRKLSEEKARRAMKWSAAGVTNKEIARRVGVHPSTIGRLLGGNPRATEPDPEAFDLDLFGDDAGKEVASAGEPVLPGTGAGCDTETERAQRASVDVSPAIGRLEDVERSCRYAGAMALHHFLTRVGADEVFSTLRREAARRYDAVHLLLAAVFCFVLSTSSLEGAKHLRQKDAGVLIGRASLPHLRTLRPAIKDLAEAVDPIAIQRSLAKGMLAADEHPPELFYVDDHFVTYWGRRPVAKGYNVRRHLAEPGRDDTFCVDEHWRAICFSSDEPKGLSVSLPGLLEELKAITGGNKVMVGFDRGGSYPKVFQALADAGMDWVTWRRAPLKAPTTEPRRRWVTVDGVAKTLLLADELCEMDGYSGPVRQLSAFEHDKVCFQVLTSNTAFKGAAMVAKLRGRWCIENTNKYLEDHQGIHWLCTYDMETEPNTAKMKNPARTQALLQRAAARAALADAERALGRLADGGVGDIDEHLAALSAQRDEITIAKDALAEVTAKLKGIPAKLPANEVDPGATRAKPRLAARALQMVCRLLAYNAELDFARHLNEYLDDDNEYRAIARHLLHLGGTISYQKDRIVVTLDRPDVPRVARALGELLAEIAIAPPTRLAGDGRPISYRLAGS